MVKRAPGANAVCRVCCGNASSTATVRAANCVTPAAPVSLPRSTTSSMWRASASAAPTPPTRSTCKACAVHAIAARPNARSPRCRCCQPAARSGPTSTTASAGRAAPRRLAWPRIALQYRAPHAVSEHAAASTSAPAGGASRCSADAQYGHRASDRLRVTGAVQLAIGAWVDPHTRGSGGPMSCAS